MALVESTKEAARGGFQGIKKVKGLLVDIEGPIDPPAEWSSTKQLVKVTLEDVSILEMFPGEEEFELKEGKLNFNIPYAEKGKTPSTNSIYMKVWVASAEKLGKKPSEFKGQVVTLEKLPVELFKQPKVDPETKKPVMGPDGKKVMETIFAVDSSGRPNHYAFVADTAADAQAIKEHIKSLVVGKKQPAALRAILVDTKAKQYPEYKDALNNGTLADLLGLIVTDEKFAEKGQEAVVETSVS